MSQKTLNNLFKGDKVIWMVFFFLCMFSIVEVYSASSSLSYKGGAYWAPITRHIFLLIAGLGAMIVTLNIKCKYFRLMMLPMFIFSVVTLLLVLHTGQATNGAQRWLTILGIKFQPSEIAKGTMVLVTAQILSSLQTENGADKRAFKYILYAGGAIIALIMMENLSTAALLCLTIFIMMIIGRIPSKIIWRTVGVVVFTIILGLSSIMIIGEDKGDISSNKELVEQDDTKREDPGLLDKVFHRADTWKHRIDKFFKVANVPPEEVDLDKDAQVAHANIAIASSNIIGKGPGNSVERDFLSQAFSDFIYAIIIEELGLEGATCVAILYIILLFRTGKIASRCENDFPAFLAMGLALLLVTQALFNMLVAVGLAPVTGQPLPLISRGGTSTIINCVYIGAILSISRSAKKRTVQAK
nr:FtsW/RodA/SpoVE family cell cycle protein [Prevotella sp.]